MLEMWMGKNLNEWAGVFQRFGTCAFCWSG